MTSLSHSTILSVSPMQLANAVRNQTEQTPKFIFEIPKSLAEGPAFEPHSKAPKVKEGSCLTVFSGESEFITSEDKYTLLYSSDTTQCAQIALFGVSEDGRKELSLTHTNYGFKLNWDPLVDQFKATTIYMKVAGMGDLKRLDTKVSASTLNLKELEASIQRYNQKVSDHKAGDGAPTNKKFKKIILVGQKLGKKCNKELHLLWDLNGDCYDATQLKAQKKLKDSDCPNYKARLARENEAGVRVWLTHNFKLKLDKPNIQLKANTQTVFSPCYFSLAIVRFIVKAKRLKNYFESTALQEFWDLDDPGAKKRMDSLMSFVMTCQKSVQSIDAKEDFPDMFVVEEAAKMLAPYAYRLVPSSQLILGHNGELGFNMTLDVGEKREEKEKLDLRKKEGLSIYVVDKEEFVLFGLSLTKQKAERLNTLDFYDQFTFSTNEAVASIRAEFVFSLLKSQNEGFDLNKDFACLLSAQQFSKILEERLVPRATANLGTDMRYNCS